MDARARAFAFISGSSHFRRTIVIPTPLTIKPNKIFRGDDEFGVPFPPYLVRAMSADIETDGSPPPQRSNNNLE
jgi:hypothetical protein